MSRKKIEKGKDEMTELSFEDFDLPSNHVAPTKGGFPSLAQLSGRLVHILPVAVRHNATSPLKRDPHTQITVDLTFFDGEPITTTLNQHGQPKAQLDPPLYPGLTQKGRFMNQAWFVRRLADKVGIPGYQGMVGRFTGEDTDQGNQMWCLTNPTSEDLAKVTAWAKWKLANPGQGIYVPAPQPTAAPMTSPFQSALAQPTSPFQPAPAQQPAPVTSPFPPASAQPAPAQQPAPVTSPFPPAPTQQPAAAQPAPATVFPWEQ